MIYTDFIAAIDLGTSHMAGMVGTKNSSGAISIIAYDVEKSDTSMRRGCVYKTDDAAYRVATLLRKLENKLNGSKIDKVYIGLDGYSMRTIDHTVTKMLGAEGEVTEEVLRALDEECRSYRPAMLDVLDIAAPVYYLDGKEERNPAGISCTRIEARYKLVVARPSLRRSIEKNIAERIRREVPQVLVSPLALANLVITEQEKDQGCILIDFGAGVTSVSAYKHGHLQMLYVIPFGGNLITRDIMTLQVAENEAERLKRTDGDAAISKEDEQQTIKINRVDGLGMREIKRIDLNEIVEARSREILENVYARLADAGIAKDLNYTIVIAGGGAALKSMKEVVSKRFNMDVRYASVRRGMIEDGEMIANNPEYTLAAALLLAGKVNCAYIPPKPEPAAVKPKPEPVAPPTVTPEPEKEVVSEPASGSVHKNTNSEEEPKNNQEPPKKKGGWISDLFGGVRDKFEKATQIDDNDY